MSSAGIRAATAQPVVPIGATGASWVSGATGASWASEIARPAKDAQ